MHYPYFYDSNIISTTRLSFSSQIQEIGVFFQKHLERTFAEAIAFRKLIRSKNFSTIMIIGMGGSVNGPAALLGLRSRKGIKIIVLDTPDPYHNNKIRETADLNKTMVLVISKSGSTAETRSITNHWIKIYSDNNLRINEYFYFILGCEDNAHLNQIAKMHSCKITQHIDLNGRFAIFSNITYFPAISIDLDITKFAEGASDAISDLMVLRDSSKILLTASETLSLYSRNIRSNALVSYSSRLNNLLSWKSQLIAESLGKNKAGITPIINLAPQSQHSHFELYLGGAKDKYFTFFSEKYEHNTDIGRLINHQASSLYHYFRDSGLPSRSFHFKILNEYSIGFLAMHFILEVAILGDALKLRAFDQECVDGLKKLIDSTEY